MCSKFHETGYWTFFTIIFQNLPNEMNVIGHNDKAIEFDAVFLMEKR